MSTIWLVDKNPLDLPAPPAWWQQLVFDYDKMLRVLPSQKEQVYRLCRIVRREARLGLQVMVVHNHPDTQACIRFGVVPVATLHPWAIRSNKIIRDLYERDTWRHGGGDPNKIVDQLEARERTVQAGKQVEADAELDEINTNAYRTFRFGRRSQVDYGQHAPSSLDEWDVSRLFTTNRYGRNPRTQAPKTALPALPGSQNRNPVVESPVPPEGTVSPSPKIVLTDL